MIKCVALNNSALLQIYWKFGMLKSSILNSENLEDESFRKKDGI